MLTLPLVFSAFQFIAGNRKNLANCGIESSKFILAFHVVFFFGFEKSNVGKRFGIT